VLEPVSPAQASRRVTDVKRAATLVLVVLAMTASAAVDARALASEGQKTQWAPTRNFSGLNARAVFAGESRRATSPYAGEEGETAAGAKEAGFTGHRTESALELIYAEQRWQDPRTGTWLSRDPVGAASYLQSPNELNPWQYAAGNPIRYVDADGRRAQTEEEAAELEEWRRLVLSLRDEVDGLRASQSPVRAALTTNLPLIGTAWRNRRLIETIEANIRQRARAIDEAPEPTAGAAPTPIVYGERLEGRESFSHGGRDYGFAWYPGWHERNLVDQIAGTPNPVALINHTIAVVGGVGAIGVGAYRLARPPTRFPDYSASRSMWAKAAQSARTNRPRVPDIDARVPVRVSVEEGAVWIVPAQGDSLLPGIIGTYDANTRNLYIDIINVPKSMQGQGVSTALYQRLLDYVEAEYGPVETVTGKMTMDNKKALLSGGVGSMPRARSLRTLGYSTSTYDPISGIATSSRPQCIAPPFLVCGPPQ
jgi:RHS repeat-associated protein